ncbi:ArsR/SmtB family transcription factor, partial [Burkholderia gladioli]
MIATDPHFPGLSRLGALLADPGRAAMLWALMDGSARPAGELTLLAGLSPSAGSAHLARLTDGGLLSLEVRGRHRYYRIASPEVAASIETLANLAQATAPLR